MNTPIKVLYVEDDELDREAFLQMVQDKKLAYDLTVAETLTQARARLAESHFDVIVADYHLPDGHSTELFPELRETPFVLLTGKLEEQLALRTLERGADDYLPKDREQRHLQAVPFAVEKTLYRQRLREAEKRFTSQLREREERLRLVTDNAPALISYIDAGLRYRFANRQYEVWFRRPVEEILGKSLTEAVGERIAARLRPRMERALAGEVVHFQDELVIGGDTTCWVEATYVPHRGPDGEVLGFYSLVQDITERKQAEAEIIALRDRLALDLEGMNRLHQLSTRFVTQGDMQTLLDAVLDAAIAITGADKGHVQLLEAASGELGIAEQHGFDPAFVEYFSHIRPGVVACGTAIKTGQCVVVEDVKLSPLFLAEPRALELVLAEGMRAVVCTPLQTRAAQMVGVLSILFTAPHRPSGRELRLLDLLARQAADFVERTQAGEAQAQLAAIVEWSEDAIISKSLDGTIRTWNAGAERMFGYRAGEVIGQPVTLLIPSDRLNEEKEVLARIRRGEPIEHFETVRVAKDGRKLHVSLTVSPVRDSQGRVIGASKIVRDIGEIVQAREVLARDKEDLERLVEERTVKLREAMADLENMSYSMVHDMRAPLRAMQSFAMLFEAECAHSLRGPGLDYFRRIREAANRLDRLITDALNYNKVVRQRLPLRSVEIGKLLRGMIETYPNLQPQAADISIEFNQMAVLGNESLLTQCLGNLLDNAVKFVLPGVKPRIRVWAEEVQSPKSAAAEYVPPPASTNYQSSANNRCVRIWIEDNGIGIPKAAQEKIFAIFERMHHESEYPGTGIGLAIALKAVERMGGRMGLESEPGKGSRFWIELAEAPEAVAAV